MGTYGRGSSIHEAARTSEFFKRSKKTSEKVPRWRLPAHGTLRVDADVFVDAGLAEGVNTLLDGVAGIRSELQQHKLDEGHLTARRGIHCRECR